MTAVIKVGGKQYYVTEGSEIFVEKLECSEGDVINFDQVLMIDSKVGNPYLTNVTVQGEVLKNGKNKKIKIFKYKNKNRSNRKKQGHRQPYTKIKITNFKINKRIIKCFNTIFIFIKVWHFYITTICKFFKRY